MPGPETDELELLTARDAGRLLGLHPMTLRRMAWRREVPALKIGRALRFRRRDLLDWLNERSVPARRDQT